MATLPGVVEASYAMPDMHWGYGFPIGGVAATEIDSGGFVSPGGVGFDISCGVLLLAARQLERTQPAWSAARPGGGWPRKHLTPTRTSTWWPKPANARGWPAGSPG